MHRHLKGKGNEVFRAIFDKVNISFDKVKSIRGTWRTGDLGDNLKTFNDLLIKNKNMSIEEAALQTYTGKMSKSLGFTQPTVSGIKNADGIYTSVDVIFNKPVTVK